MATSTKTPYEILGTPRNSTNNQLLAVYRTKIHEHLQNRISPVNFRLICRAHETLSDYNRRKQYDSLKKWTSEIPIDRYTPQQLAAEPHLIHHLKKRLEQASLKEINAEDPNTGHTTLYCAARAGNLEAVKFLIEHGAEPDQHTTSTALYVASSYGHANIVRYLLENGADYRIVNSSDRTAEEEAYGNDVKQVFVKLKQNCYVRAAADELDWFQKNGLIEHIDTEYFSQHQTLLHCACKKGYFDMVRWLVEQCSANVDLVDSNGNSALHLAVYGGHLDIVDYLLNRGCNSTLRNQRGITAEEDSKHSRWIADLFESMRERDMFDMARTGVDWWFYYYFDIELKDAVDSNGVCLLYYACRYGHYPVAKWLLEHGANVNIRMTTELKSTQLNPSIVELLLEYGVDVNIKNDFDEVDNSLSQNDQSIYVEIDSHERDEAIRLDDNNEQKPIVELEIDNLCNVQDDFSVAEHSLDFQQVDTGIMSAVSCVRYMNSKLVDTSLRLTLYQTSSADIYHEDTRQVVTMLSEEKTISSSILKFPFKERRIFNSGDLTTFTFSTNCIKKDDRVKTTRFYRSDLQKYDLPNAIYLLKTIFSNTEKSDAVLLLLLESISHQSDVRLYMLTMPLPYSFSSDIRSNQLSMLGDIHAFIPHVNIISIHLRSPTDIFIAATTGHSLETLNNLMSSTCLTLREQNTNTFPQIDYHETNMSVVQSTLLNELVLPDTVVSSGKRVTSLNHVACTLSNQDKSDCTKIIVLNPRVYYTPKIPYVMSFMRGDQKPKAVRKRNVKRNNSKTIKCTTPITMNQTQVTIWKPLQSMLHWSSQRLILSPMLKWPQWLHLLHWMYT